MQKWDSIRHSFNLDPNYVHMSLGMLAPHPLPVREAIEKHRKGFDANPSLYYRNKNEMEQLVLEQASSFLDTDATQIAITESTTMGLSVILTGIKLNCGDEVLTSTHEHYAAVEILRFKKKREGIKIKQISLYEESFHATVEEIIENVAHNISEKTRLVVLTWVHSCTGVKIPVQQIGNLIKSINQSRKDDEKILLIIDGLHALGVENFNVEELNCDFFIAGCHKWLFGPRGTGLIWGHEKAWDQIIPIFTSFKWEAFWPWFNKKPPEDSCPKAWFCTPGGFQAYEHRWALCEAFDFQKSIGKQLIEKRIHTFSSICKKFLGNNKRIVLKTPLNEKLSSGIICFDVPNIDPAMVVEWFLNKKIITGQTPYRTSFCRFMPSIINQESDLEIVSKACEELEIFKFLNPN